MHRSSVVAAAFVIAVTSALSAGCASRCPRVAAARDVLTTRRGADARGADVRVTLPFARTNELLAATLREQPLSVPIGLPDLGPIELSAPVALTALAREVRLRSGPPDRVRFALRIEIRDAAEPLTTLAVVAEVAPVLERAGSAAELLIRFGPENLLSLRPELEPGAEASLLRAVTRWLPAPLRDRLPQPLLEAAARKLGAHLVGTAYHGLRRTLLSRLGEVTRLRLRLPDVPVARVAVRSLETPGVAADPPGAAAAEVAVGAASGALLVEILTDLPVRRGLPSLTAGASGASDVTGEQFTVRLSPSATAELASWGIDRGLLPRWYTRSLSPSPDGEFRPRFDHLAGDAAHPFKIYAFQERGGCSYFRVGVQAAVAMDGEQLKVTVLDRELEEATASPVIEVAAWVKYFLFGSVDLSKRVAARTRLTVGGRSFDTRVAAAALSLEELRFTLQLDVAPKAPPAAAAR